MITLALRRTPEPDDYTVWCGDRQVGRIYRSHRPDSPWFWCVTCYGHATAEDMAFAADIEAAKSALKASWGRSVEQGRGYSTAVYSMPSAGSQFGTP